VSPSGLFQAVAEVDQRLMLRQGATVQELMRLDLGQDLDLKGRRVGDTFARFATGLGAYGLDGVARFSLIERRLTQLSGTFNFDDHRGSGAYVRLDHLVTDGPDRLRAGSDELFGPRSTLPRCVVGGPDRPPTCWEDAETLVVGGRYRFGFGLGLSYEAIIQRLGELAPGEPVYNRLAQQVVGLSYGPACDCWRVDVHAIFHKLPGPPYKFQLPEFGFNLTIARFGSLGNGR
jgi:LPS-assembly protein